MDESLKDGTCKDPRKSLGSQPESIVVQPRYASHTRWRREREGGRRGVKPRTAAEGGGGSRGRSVSLEGAGGKNRRREKKNSLSRENLVSFVISPSRIGAELRIHPPPPRDPTCPSIPPSLEYRVITNLNFRVADEERRSIDARRAFSSPEELGGNERLQLQNCNCSRLAMFLNKLIIQPEEGTLVALPANLPTDFIGTRRS